MYFGETMTDEKRKRLEMLFQQHGPILKASLLREHGIYSRDLSALARGGYIQKLKTGYYIWNETVPDVSDIETASAVVPFGIICLQSAARLHELTTLNPLTVTIAIPANRTRVALPAYPPVDLIAFALPTFELGLMENESGIIRVRMYDRERTVCDFFRKRRRLGDDLALEVLQTYMRGPRNLQKLFDYAGNLRIKDILKPYVEALI
jgi:predicted transcriptional regulator of viral defense system